MARYAIKHVPSNRFLGLDDDREFVLFNPDEKFPTFGQKSEAESEIKYYDEIEIEPYWVPLVGITYKRAYPISEFEVAEV
jgi:hypothetical protein